MYAEDSFYTLSQNARLGLLAVSVILTGIVVAIGVVTMRTRRWSVRVALAVMLFSLFVWASPQAYYEYYQLILTGLPRQWVIGQPPPFDELLSLVTFTGPQTISAHGLGGLFWGLIWLSWWIRPKVSEQPDPDL
ncbi:MAG: hypothetical protein WA790_17815 [Sulfitobacter sp.]